MTLVRDSGFANTCWNRGPQGLGHRCLRGLCECPCTNLRPPKKQKFTGEGQMKIDLTDCITITTKS